MLMKEGGWIGSQLLQALELRGWLAARIKDSVSEPRGQAHSFLLLAHSFVISTQTTISCAELYHITRTQSNIIRAILQQHPTPHHNRASTTTPAATMSDSEGAAAASSHPTTGGKSIETVQAQQNRLQGERQPYKSWRKKYRKMRVKFDGVLEENKTLFKQEHKLEGTAKRLREELE